MISPNRNLAITGAFGIMFIVFLVILYRQLALITLVEYETRSHAALPEILSNIAQMQQLQWLIIAGVLVSIVVLYVLLTTYSRHVDRLEIARQEAANFSKVKMHYKTHYNSITNLPNRLYLDEMLNQSINWARHHKTKFAVIFLDVDHFNLVNDSFGYEAGDELLRLIARRLSDSLRLSDTLFHLGSDKFIVLLENLVDSKASNQLASQMIKSMREPFLIHNQAIITTMSFGLVTNSGERVKPASLVKNAESAMYLAKQNGGNKLQLYTPNLNGHAHSQLTYESALQQALGKNEFVILYQPRLAVDEETVLGFEALIRWRRSDGQLVEPTEFIPVLEKKGIIYDVGHWVLYEACSQCMVWENAGLSPVRISVNVSPQQFRDPDFVNRVKNVLHETKLESRFLELELTESALLHNPEETVATMKVLKSMGISLSLDDFGTGYSSFSYLKTLPVDFLKIDRSFVREIEQNAIDLAIVSAFVSVADNLEIGIVAEGVENHGQAMKLIQIGCHELQGYLYAKPMKASEATKWLPKKINVKSAGLAVPNLAHQEIQLSDVRIQEMYE